MIGRYREVPRLNGTLRKPWDSSLLYQNVAKAEFRLEPANLTASNKPSEHNILNMPYRFVVNVQLPYNTKQPQLNRLLSRVPKLPGVGGNP